jgi:Mg-chelatase subunit ChlD
MNRCHALFFVACLLLGGCGVGGTSSAPTAAPNTEQLRATIEAELRATIAAQQTQPTETPRQPPTEQPTQTIAADTAVPTATAAPEATSAAIASPAATPPPVPTTVTSFEPNGEGRQPVVNIQLVFDASGSMAEPLGAETRIVAARRAIEQVLATLPADNPNMNIGFRVFGHRGDNSEAGRSVSCGSTELLVQMDGINLPLLREQANAWEPTGWTPISLALQQAAEAFPTGENIRNVIIIVTDGEETCGGDPCEVAEALAASRAELRIDLIGFGVSPAVADVLRCIPANSGGVYADAQNGDALAQSLNELIVASQARSYLRIVSLNPAGEPDKLLQLRELLDEQGQPAQILNRPAGTAGALASGTVRLELKPGTYRFTVTPNFIQFGGMEPDQDRTYTAVVAAGQETVALVGIGSMTLRRQGVDKRFLCDSVFEISENGSWRPFALPGLVIGCKESFLYDEAYLLPPGVYRIRDTKRDVVLVDMITIAPGKQVTIDIRGQDSGG